MSDAMMDAIGALCRESERFRRFVRNYGLDYLSMPSDLREKLRKRLKYEVRQGRQLSICLEESDHEWEGVACADCGRTFIQACAKCGCSESGVVRSLLICRDCYHKPPSW